MKDGFQPVIIDVEEGHWWLCCLQDHVSKPSQSFSKLGKTALQLATLDDSIGEIQQMNL
jgi:hypothetical protein